MQEQYSVGIYARLSRDDERAGSVCVNRKSKRNARPVCAGTGLDALRLLLRRWGLRYDLRPSGVQPAGAGRDRPQDQFGTNQRPQQVRP